jgi:competence protein ComEA
MAAESRGTALIWAIAAVIGAIALWRLLGPGGDGSAAGEPVRVDRSAGAATAQTDASRAARSGALVYVHVAGAVRRPGLVRVDAGSRIAAALAEAGGPVRKADLTGVNLAAQVEDGQQVVVPRAGAVPGSTAALGSAAAPGSTAAAGSATAPGIKPSLGTATVEQLDEIDGIGPTLAERIVAYRTENGGFGSVDELKEVDGIGEKRFETLRDALQP